MLIDMRHLNVPVSDGLYEFTKRYITRALKPFEEAISRVDVRTKDVNGPRGGIDVESSVMVTLASVEQPVIITGKGTDAYAAVLDARARLHESLSRALGRRRRIGRSRRSLSRAAAPRTTAASAPKETTASGSEEATADKSGGSGNIVVTALDDERLRKLIRASRGSRDRGAAEALAEELDRAAVVPAERIAGNVVTMNSRVVFKDEETGENREISLVYPQDSDPLQGRISVLAPVGAALLGLSVGQTIDWPLPQGRLKRYRVVEVVYQPEAAGNLHL